MIEDHVKKDVRDLVEAAIAEGVTLRVASVHECILELHGNCHAFLVRYHIGQTAGEIGDITTCLPIFDSQLEQEISDHLRAAFDAKPDCSVSHDWIVGRVLTTHSVRSSRFRGPLIDPDWHAACALAGTKHLILDVLSEDWELSKLLMAYVVTREAEETVVPSSLLTDAELRSIEEEGRRSMDAYNAEVDEIRDENNRRNGDPT